VFDIKIHKSHESICLSTLLQIERIVTTYFDKICCKIAAYVSFRLTTNYSPTPK